MRHILNLEIVTPVGSKYAGKVSEVTAPGALGELGILPGHIPILSVLDIGSLTYIDVATNSPKHLAVGGGYLEVNADQLIVLTETAEFSDEIDVERAEAAKSRAEEALNEDEAGSATYAKKMRALRRAKTRLAIATHDAN